LRSAGILKFLLSVAAFSMLRGIVPTAYSVTPWNVGYRKLDIHDPVSGELFPVAVWYPTRVPPTPLFLTGSVSACRLPAMLCRWIAFEMQVASNSPPADGKFGLIVISHGAGGFALNHLDLALALASGGYVVAAPTHPRGGGNDISGIGVWVGRPKQVSRVIDAVLEDMPASRIADAIRTTPGSAPLVVRPHEKPPGRWAIFQTSVIRGCAPLSSWRRMPPRSQTMPWRESSFRSVSTAPSATT
jgi:predicted dienelactone hydrolase